VGRDVPSRRIAKWLATIAVLLTVGVVLYMLLGRPYSAQMSSNQTNTTRGLTTFEVNGPVVIFWAGFLLFVSAVGAIGMLKNKISWIWISASLLTILSALGMATIGVFVAPIALTFIAAATILSVSPRGPR
jgi:ABC-type Na+ efflux pump permease subunit